MATETPRDQPTNVATQEALRPPDNSVVTSDTDHLGADPEKAGANSPPAAAGEVTTSDTGTNKPPPAGSDDNAAKPRNRSAERRIKKLSAKISRVTDVTVEQQRTIDAQAKEIADLKAATPDIPEPKLEDFKTPAEYAKAYGTWDKGQKAAAAPPTRSTPPANPPPADPPALDPVVAKFHEDGRKLLGDEFDEALEEEGTAISQVMAEFLFDDEVGPAVYVHLSNNQEDARKIYDSTAPKAIKAMEALAAKAVKGELDVEGALQIAPAPGATPPADPPAGQVDGDPPPKAAKPNPGGTNAPPPPSNTRESGDSNLQADPENEGMEEYAARRRKDEARRRGYPV